ncbi:MAG: hypothetical protein O3C43_13650 [Verrucomicrobia bacterium]|nr:hypothetical protein [Verrucomicrobiota bacterium]MDA1067537.1 hypothetical protein [Verrucomicrobiota bacterium]
MKLLLIGLLLISIPLVGIEPVDPGSPKLYQEQKLVIDKTVNNLNTIPATPASGLYRSWINPVKTILNPANQSQDFNLVSFPVRYPSREQTFFEFKEWQPGNAVKLYEKSKDFERIRSPLALKNFNRFNYLRNSSSP